jgi:hypothetical protein
MFTIDPNITDLNIREKNMVKVFFSINNHQVATPEMMLEEAQSYIMFFHESDGKSSSYIGLHLLLTGRKLFYAHSSNPFPEGEMDSVEEEALSFVEGLGALVDEVDFTTMSTEEKQTWIDTQSIFSQKQEPASTAEAQDGGASPDAAFPIEEAPQTLAPEAELAPHVQQTPEAPAPAPEPVPQVQQAPEAPAPAPEPVQPTQQAPEVSAPATESVQQTQQAPQEPTPAAEPVRQTHEPVQAPPEAPPVPEIPKPTTAFESRQALAAPPQETSGREATVLASHAGQGHRPPVPQSSQQPPKAPPVTPDEARVQPAMRAAGAKTAPAITSKRKQEIMQKAIKAGAVKPKPSIKQEAQAAAGVVSRDREALARLLTSF